MVMAWNPWYSAESDTFERFMEQYDAKLAVEYREPGGTTALHGALMNSGMVDRVRIANRLLDDGADASAVIRSDNVNALHVLFAGRKKHDFVLEAPLLKRLLDGGADINLRSARSGVPLQALEDISADDEELAPFYDVVFERPDIDFDVIVNRYYNRTLRDFLFNLPWGRADLLRRAQEYDAAHPRD